MSARKYRLPEEFSVLQALPSEAWRGRHGALIWNPQGQGRLKTDESPNPCYGKEESLDDLAYTDTALTFDNVPLFRLHESGCPTCERLLQLGYQNPGFSKEQARSINDLTLEAIRSCHDHSWAESVRPLIKLLEPGAYLIYLNQVYPTNGEGEFFWNDNHELRKLSALSFRFGMVERPRFLIPSQTTDCFRERSLTLARRDFHFKPGIALSYRGAMAVLLDGHHRAMAAAENSSPFWTIVIEPYWVWNPTQKDDHCGIRPVIRRRIHEWKTGRKNVGEVKNHAQPIARAIDRPRRDLCTEVIRYHCREYPLFDWVTEADRLFRDWEGGVSRQEIENVFNGMVPDDGWFRGTVIQVAIDVLLFLKHPQLIEAVRRVVAGSFGQADKEYACRRLAGIKSTSVEDFFIELSIGDGTILPSALKTIVDEYLSDPPSLQED